MVRADGSLVLDNYGVDTGLYSSHLQNWFNHFPRNQVGQAEKLGHGYVICVLHVPNRRGFCYNLDGSASMMLIFGNFLDWQYETNDTAVLSQKIENWAIFEQLLIIILKGKKTA